MEAAERQAEALQHLLERLDGGEPLESVRAGAGDIAGLLDVAVIAARALPTKARPAFKARSQAELQSLMPGLSAAVPRRTSVRWLPRVAAALLAVTLVMFTAVAASADSLPGEALYPVKRALEETRVVLTPSGRSRAFLRLSLAGARADEIRRLMDEGQVVAPEWLDALLAAQAAAAAEAAETGDPELVARAAERLRQSADLVDAVRGGQPSSDTDGSTGVVDDRDAPEAERPGAEARPTREEPPATPVAPTTVVEGTATASRPMTAGQPPIETSPVPPTEGPVGVPRPGWPAADRPARPGPTDAPPSAGNQPEPTPEPTLRKAHEREATQQAPPPWPPVRPTREGVGSSSDPGSPEPATPTARSRRPHAAPSPTAQPAEPRGPTPPPDDPPVEPPPPDPPATAAPSRPTTSASP